MPPTAVPQTWDIQADVVVVGFGAAGACAALEARRPAVTWSCSTGSPVAAPLPCPAA